MKRTLFLTLLLAFALDLTGLMALAIAATSPAQVMTASLADWFTWDTFLFLVIIVLGGLLTIVTVSHRAVVGEMKELAEAIRAGYKDDKLTDVERKRIMKEALDVVWALIKVAWRPLGIPGTVLKKMVQRR